jgi:hypothetical protein
MNNVPLPNDFLNAKPYRGKKLTGGQRISLEELPRFLEEHGLTIEAAFAPHPFLGVQYEVSPDPKSLVILGKQKEVISSDNLFTKAQ